jgi:hypothetical protein
MNTTISIGTTKLITETIWHIVFFPIWWYSRGFVLVSRFAGSSIKNQYINLGLGVWLSNLFVPMYGASDIASRIISFFIRFLMVVVRGLALLLWTIVVAGFLIFYLALLLVTILGFLYHGLGLSWASL